MCLILFTKNILQLLPYETAVIIVHKEIFITYPLSIMNLYYCYSNSIIVKKMYIRMALRSYIWKVGILVHWLSKFGTNSGMQKNHRQVHFWCI